MVSAGVIAASSLQWLRATVKTAPKDRHEAAAMFVHAVLLHHGFRPLGTPVPEPAPVHEMPADWNSHGYGGKYRHFQSALTFELRMVPLGSRLMATATVLEQDDKTYVGDFRLDTFVRDDAKVGEGQQVDWDETFKNIQDFASLIQLNLAYKLVPDSAKTVDGERGAATTRTQPEPQQSRREEPYRDDPLRVGPPRRPIPAQYVDPMNPFASVGDDDLIPAGLRAPGLGPAIPGIGGPGGGSLVGPDHPLFGQTGPDTGLGPRLPRGAVPPGARFDPFGPPGVGGGGFDPSRFGPDPDHDRPPPDMYW